MEANIKLTKLKIIKLKHEHWQTRPVGNLFLHRGNINKKDKLKSYLRATATQRGAVPWLCAHNGNGNGHGSAHCHSAMLMVLIIIYISIPKLTITTISNVCHCKTFKLVFIILGSLFLPCRMATRCCWHVSARRTAHHSHRIPPVQYRTVPNNIATAGHCTQMARHADLTRRGALSRRFRAADRFASAANQDTTRATAASNLSNFLIF